jgi:glycosyltransferase involved in cell wall biosynthesis
MAATPVLHGSEACNAGLRLTSENDVLGWDIPPAGRNHGPVERSFGNRTRRNFSKVTTMRRVLFLALWGPGRAAYQRYRVEQFVQFWRERGVETSQAWALDANTMPIFYGQDLTGKARVAVAGALRRIWSTTRHVLRRDYDVVLVLREAFFLGGPWSEWIAARRAPLIFDFDDAIWLPSISEGNRRFAALKNAGKVATLARMANTVIVGNSYLASWARKQNSNVQIVPTCVDTDRYVPRTASRGHDQPIVIGWSGSAATVGHFKLIQPVLQRIRRKFGARVEFKLVGVPEFRNDALGVRGEAWSAATEVHSLQSMDIGIMPLPDDEWSKGKCGLKALTYMSVGIPAIVSPVGVSHEIVADGVNGFAPPTDDEWVEALSQLILDEELRRKLGAAGRATVVERYSVERWREPLLRIIRRTAGI